ncbi:MAG: LamG domain-containing protein [Chitinophagaceae bacterium]
MRIKTFILLISLSTFYSCAKEYSCEDCIPPSPPEVKTVQITDITINSARFHGELIKTGNLLITEFGFCWASHPIPTLGDNKIGFGQTDSLQSFDSLQNGLSPNTIYYLRAFATNSIGTVYGQELSFKTEVLCRDTSLHFDGIYINNTGSFNNDHVDIGANGPMSVIGTNLSYTIEAWVKRGHVSYPNGLERIYSKDNVFQFRVVNDNFIGEIGSASIQTPYPADTFWHHLAFVRDKSSNTLKLFIDGQLKVTAADISGAVSNNGSMVCIGARNNGGGIYELWTGNLKYLRVSNVARYSNSFIAAQRYSTDVNTLAIWPCNDASGNVLKDISGNNDGGITNAEWRFGVCY